MPVRLKTPTALTVSNEGETMTEDDVQCEITCENSDAGSLGSVGIHRGVQEIHVHGCRVREVNRRRREKAPRGKSKSAKPRKGKG